MTTTAAALSALRHCEGDSAAADILLIGLGNLLLGDEGVGIHALRQLQAHYRFEPPIECLDGGTSGIDLLPWFQDYNRIILVDAVDFRAAPGHVGVLRDEEIVTTLNEKMSLHHLGVGDVLSLTQLLDYTPAELVMVGVQPEAMALDLALTPTVAARVPAVIAAVQGILAGWGVRLTAI